MANGLQRPESGVDQPWVALIGPELEENLALRYLAAALRASGYEARILPYHEDDHFAAVLAQVNSEHPPFLVGVSMAFQWRVLDATALVMALRDGGYDGHITAGGHFATFACTELLTDFPELDSICRHESEPTIVALADAIRADRPFADIPGLAFRDGEQVARTCLGAVPDLASLPFPDRSGEPARCLGHAISPIVGSRGCYANCTFCCIAAWHEQTLPGKRYRLRDPDDIAAEMVQMQRERGIEIFVFHDDNFFLPARRASKERFEALADALERRGIGRFATVVKARPTDVRDDVFDVLVNRLNCIRCYIGIETDADQGLDTLRRWSSSKKNHQAIEVAQAHDLYVCFNMLIFDPDTTLDSLETNLDFMAWAPEYPSNFGRAELYAGTPLLARLQADGRATGDYMRWNYELYDADAQRVFELAMPVFRPRNFAAGALANEIMGTRFDLEVARFFHPEIFEATWLDEGRRLTRELTLGSVDAMRRIIAHVRDGHTDDALLQRMIAIDLRREERRIWLRCRQLAAEVQARLGTGAPLTRIGDITATPLQQPLLATGSRS
ncbi:MAG: B12-binding domain-containing radical SAM protein [Deltaproteobacteria bacterium]|nr:MAG: B12-binding domain-containing radical SAM protein [Deltaproteobacteria bacterium]